MAIIALAFLSSCSSGGAADLQYVKQARSLAAEWALVNEQANAGKLTPTYVDSMRGWLRENVKTTASALARPQSPYGAEIQALLREPPAAHPSALRGHADALKRFEDQLESA